MKMKPLLEVAEEIMKDINEAKKMTDEDIDLSEVKFCTCDRGKLMDKHFKLCLVLDNQAWFTTQDVTKQWGDDWDDAPYEHNAGPPYEYHEKMDCLPYDIKKVYWESSTCAIPAFTSKASVEDINNGMRPWLFNYEERTNINAGTTLEEFKKLVDVYECNGELRGRTGK